METEESCLKCMPFIPRKGKKILFILVTINVVIIWFLYRQSINFLYFDNHSINNAATILHPPLQDVPVFHIPMLNKKDMAPFYIEIKSNTWCFRHGTDITESKKRKRCVCIDQWYGLDCGIPAAIWKSDFLQEGKNGGVEIRRREKPRRVIASFVISDEYHMLDINVNYLSSVVDLFLAVQDRNTIPSVLSRFKSGFLAELQNKIMPLLLNKSVPYRSTNEWTMLMLDELWASGWKRLSDFRPDDILIFAHVSSIISHDVLLFLKLYDGYPEPFYFKVRPLLFKFWRTVRNATANQGFVPFKPSGCTFQFIASMCNYAMLKYFTGKCSEDVQHKVSFQKKHWLIKEWIIGDEETPSGWHCNLCCKDSCSQYSINRQQWLIENISASLLNNKQANVSVIDYLLQHKNLYGKNLSFEIIPSDDPFFAPKVLSDNEKYSYLLN